MTLNLLESANQRKQREKAEELKNKERAYMINNELTNIRLSLFKLSSSLEIAKKVWNLFKEKQFPEITYYANAAYKLLENNTVPTIDQLDEIVSYLKNE